MFFEILFLEGKNSTQQVDNVKPKNKYKMVHLQICISSMFALFYVCEWKYIFCYTQNDSYPFSYSIIFLFIMTKYDKRVLHSSSIRTCQSEQNKNTSKRKTTSRSTRVHFQKQEKILEKAKKRKKEALQTGKSKTKVSISTMKLDERNTLILESCSSQRPIRVATRKGMRKHWESY